MARDDTSVATSIQQILEEEDRRRAEQVRLAYQRKLEEERVVAAERKRREAGEREQVETARREEERKAGELRRDREQQETARLAELERIRVEAELRAKVTLMGTEQQHELERLTLVRDQRVIQLEGQRILLGALLGTLTLGALALYLFVLSPHAARQTLAIAQLEQEKRLVLDERQRERNSLEQRLSESEAQHARVLSELQQAQAQLRARPPEHTPSTGTTGPQRLPVRPPRPRNSGCDPHDPLCDDLGGR